MGLKNFVIATGQRIEEAVLTGFGTLAGTLPITNLQTYQPGEVARWTDLGTIAVEVDLTAAIGVNVFAFGPHNGSASAQVRIRAATSQAALTSSPSYDSGLISAWPATGRPTGYGYESDKLWSFFWFDPVKTFRYWRLDVSDASNPDEFFDIGRLYIADAWQPLIGARTGASKGFSDPSEHQLAIGGQTWVVSRSRSRTLDLTLGFMSEDEMETNVYEIQRRRGIAKDILLVRDPLATTHLHRNLIYGLMTDLPAIINAHYGLFEARFVVKELVQ